VASLRGTSEQAFDDFSTHPVGPFVALGRNFSLSFAGMRFELFVAIDPLG
jgi:hypothetical protein